MDNIFNIKFLLFFIIVIFIFHHRKKLYFTKLKEGYQNILDINYLESHKIIKPKKLYSLEHDTLEFIPTLYTNFKYSLEYKLGYEISRIFKIRNSESPGLYDNIINAHKKDRGLFLCSETDYYDYIKENPKKKDLLFVCGCYYQHFLLFVRIDLDFDLSSFQDLVIFIDSDYIKTAKLKNIVTIGIPDKKTNSYQDALKIFKSMGIDITNTKYTNLKFILDTEKNLLSRLKLPREDSKHIDCLYLTTSSKHPYMQEYLEGNNIDVFSTQEFRSANITSLYGGNYLFKYSFDKKKFSRIIKQKNIYAENNEKITVFNNSKETRIIGSKYLKVFSSRVILVASQDLSNTYIQHLLRNIYGSLDKLRNKLNNYLLVPEKQNVLVSPLDPYEMSYCHQIAKYHPGAHEFYQEIQIIDHDNSIADNLHQQENKYF